MTKVDAILDGDFNSCMQKLIQHNLDPVVRQRKETLYKQRELKDLGLKRPSLINPKLIRIGSKTILGVYALSLISNTPYTVLRLMIRGMRLYQRDVH